MSSEDNGEDKYSYNSNPLLKRVGSSHKFTKEQIEEIKKCKADPVYFIKKYCKIISLDSEDPVNFELYDYQSNFVGAINNNRRVVSLQPRQSGKTQTVAAYICWYVTFQSNQTVAILANKADAAREILSRCKFMYEYLPKWMQHGIKKWNEGSIFLENGSKAFTAATSKSGLRGRSCVTGDTKVCILKGENIYYNDITKNISHGKKSVIYHTFCISINNITNSIYVSYHKTDDVNDGYIGNGVKLRRDVEKYGAENFTSKSFVLFYENGKYLNDVDILKVLTEDGFKNFESIIDQGVSSHLLRITFNDGSFIKATHDHRFMTERGWIEVSYLIHGDVLNNKIIQKIERIENENVYDFYNVEDTHSYYSNGVISHNCNMLYIDEAAAIPNNIAEDFFTAIYPIVSSGKKTKIIITSTPIGYNHFHKYWNEAEKGINGFIPVRVNYWDHPNRDKKWAEEQRQLLGEVKFRQEILCTFQGSSHTLISGDALSKLTSSIPIYSKDDLNIINNPESGHIYMMGIDSAEGVGGDSSAFTVIDITSFPYRTVASYNSNTISYLLYPDIIYKVAKLYNDAFVLVEVNSIGNQVAIMLYQDLEYENILMVSQKPKYGQYLSVSSKANYGVKTTKQTKRIGCQTLKTLVEEDKLIISDEKTIRELSTFIENGTSYEADEGYHDDSVMSLVLFAWAYQDPMFRDITNVDTRKAIFEQRMKEIEDDVLPVGFYNDGMDEEDDVYL